MKNIIINSDSYKASHYCQYPPGTKYISSYIAARGGEYETAVFFGLQAFLKEYLLMPITAKDIEFAQSIIEPHGLPFNKPGWEYILEKHNGYLPLKIEAIAEGSVVRNGTVMCQLTNTDPNCFWLPGYIETSILRGVWYPTTVATRSYHIKNILKEYLLKTSDNLDCLQFMLHDFGARGCSSLESSILGGMAHLVNFLGSDNLAAIAWAQNYYGADIAGYSIPAAEHGTIISWGQESEAKAYSHIISQFAKYPAVSIVSDSYDLFNAINNIFGGDLYSLVSKHPGVIVIRPDSGDPKAVVTKVIKVLAEKFGAEKNGKGYLVLPKNIRLIQGDGVSESKINEILCSLTSMGFSAENIVFGMGAELLQKLDRDTLGFIMKVSAIHNGQDWFGVSKKPKTDKKKFSLSGRFAVVNGSNVPINSLGNSKNDLSCVYLDGKLVREVSFDNVRSGIIL